MNLDRIVNLIAPFYCLGCNRIGHGLCEACEASQLFKIESRCYRCHRFTLQYQVCTSCRTKSSLMHLWVLSAYEGLGKDVIDLMKFERAQSFTKDVGRAMANLAPILPGDTIVCPIPTSPARVRIRGYDQAKLIAKTVAKHKKLKYKSMLIKVNNTRQVGSGRDQRFKQAENAYELISKTVKNRKILLVDDVTTSGATLEAAARLLKKAGASQVDGIVFAQALD